MVQVLNRSKYRVCAIVFSPLDDVEHNKVGFKSICKTVNDWQESRLHLRTVTYCSQPSDLVRPRVWNGRKQYSYQSFQWRHISRFFDEASGFLNVVWRTSILNIVRWEHLKIVNIAMATFLHDAKFKKIVIDVNSIPVQMSSRTQLRCLFDQTRFCVRRPSVTFATADTSGAGLNGRLSSSFGTKTLTVRGAE